jgi:hypothetical protein
MMKKTIELTVSTFETYKIIEIKVAEGSPWWRGAMDIASA